MSSHLHSQKAIIAYLIAATISTPSPAQSQDLGQLEIRREATESTSKIKIEDEMSLREAIRLANRLALMGETAEASAIWEKAVKWGEKNLGNEHPDLATGLINLANLYRDLERHPEAERLLERAAEIDKKNYGPQSLERAGSLTSLAMTLLDQDKLEAARQTQAEALDIYRHTLGTNHHYTSVALNNLGLIYKEDGQLDTAERLLKQSLQASTKNEPESKGLAVATLGTLATIYIRKAQYSQAEDSLQAALSRLGDSGDHKEDIDKSTIYNILGDLYRLQGRFKESEEALKKSVRIRTEATGGYSRLTIVAKSNLALTYKVAGKIAEAEALYIDALSSAESKYGRESIQLITLLSNIGSLYSDNKDYTKALDATEKALSILRKSTSDSRDRQVAILNNLGNIHFGIGDYTKGFLYLRQAMDIIKQQYGEDHPWYFQSLRSLALRAVETKQPFDAVAEQLNSALDHELNWLRKEVPHISEANRPRQLVALGNRWMLPFQLIELNAKYAGLALRTRIRRQGIIQEVQREQFLALRTQAKEQNVADALASLRSKASSTGLSEHQRKELQNTLGLAEREAYGLLPPASAIATEPDLISRSIPTEGALIEFQRFRAFDLVSRNATRRGEDRYLALVLRPGSPVVSIGLGAANQIDSAIHQALNASAEDNSDAKNRWAEVSKLVLDPLAPTLKGSTQWFISPDAELNRVPFAALPSPQDPNQPLGRSIKLRLLTTGRDLLRLQQPAKAAQAPVVVANPNFNRTGHSSTAIATANSGDEPQSRSADLAAKNWAPLPSSEREGQQIGTLLATRPITGNDATTTRLQQLKSPRVLHIASHGFFVADVEKKPDDPLQVLQDQSAMLRAFRGEDPQLRSGLVLAGANQPEADPNDDGYLTAAEAVSLQLDGTELVVLSACSTGQGDIRTGEGVYGLQRSLTVAGARSTLLSLWKVDDAATAEFMSRFYQRLKAGEGRSDALAATQKEFREGLVRDPKSGEAWDTPYYWAAWQLVGDWRPIPGL